MDLPIVRYLIDHVGGEEQRSRRVFYFFFQAEDGIRDLTVTGVQTCALPILRALVAADSALPAAKAFDSTLAAVGGNPDGRGGFGGFGGPRPAPTFVGVNGDRKSVV